MLILKIFFIVALIKILQATNKPFVCSGVYGGGVLLLSLAFGAPIELALLAAGIGFVLSSIYFWLLDRFEDAGLVFWLILIGGLAIGLV